MDSTIAVKANEPLFRISKRRKVFRRRRSSSGESIDQHQPLEPEIKPDDSSHQTAFSVSSLVESESPGEQSTGVNEDILRRRRLARTRRGGVGFSADSNITKSGANEESALAVREEPPSALAEAAKKFAAATGQVSGRTDKQSVAFVESEMAKRRAGNTNLHINPGDMRSIQQPEDGGYKPLPTKDPATAGKIHEIDLGPDTTTRNIALTEAATKHLQSGQLTEPAGVEQRPTQKVRMGRDGKPRKPKNRRGSQDLKRDDFVDAVLKESKLGIYDETSESTRAQQNGDDPADERLAEQFCREYLEDMQDRKATKRAQTVSQQSVTGVKQRNPLLEKQSKGPKLGGSRSQRAAMHAQRMEGRR